MTFGTKLSPKFGARLRVQLAQLGQRLLNQRDRIPGAAFDQRQPVVFQIFQVIADERLQLFIIGHARQELHQQAFAQVASGDAGRVELLHDGQSPLGRRQLFRAGVGVDQVFQAALQIAVGVEVVDDAVAHLPQRRVNFKPAELIVQVVLQRLRPGDHVGHGVVLALALFFQSGAGRPRPFFEVVGPLLVHIEQPLEIVLVVLGLIDDQLSLFGRGSVGIDGFGGLFRQVEIFLLQVEHRVFLNLLLDAFLQRHDRQLQDLHRLDHARCKHLLLHQPHFLTKGQSHGCSVGN